MPIDCQAYKHQYCRCNYDSLCDACHWHMCCYKSTWGFRRCLQIASEERQK